MCVRICVCKERVCKVARNVFCFRRESVKSGHHCCPCQAPPPPVLVTTSPNARIIRQSSQPEASVCCCSGCCCPLHTGAAPSAASLRQLREHGDGIAGIAADSLRINGGIRQFRQVSRDLALPHRLSWAQIQSSVMQEYRNDRTRLLDSNLRNSAGVLFTFSRKRNEKKRNNSISEVAFQRAFAEIWIIWLSKLHTFWDYTFWKNKEERISILWITFWEGEISSKDLDKSWWSFKLWFSQINTEYYVHNEHLVLARDR